MIEIEMFITLYYYYRFHSVLLSLSYRGHLNYQMNKLAVTSLYTRRVCRVDSRSRKVGALALASGCSSTLL